MREQRLEQLETERQERNRDRPQPRQAPPTGRASGWVLAAPEYMHVLTQDIR